MHMPASKRYSVLSPSSLSSSPSSSPWKEIGQYGESSSKGVVSNRCLSSAAFYRRTCSPPHESFVLVCWTGVSLILSIAFVRFDYRL